MKQPHLVNGRSDGTSFAVAVAKGNADSAHNGLDRPEKKSI